MQHNNLEVPLQRAQSLLLRAKWMLQDLYPTHHDPKYLLTILRTVEEGIRELDHPIVQEIQQILKFFDNASLAFRRKDRFVMCNNEYTTIELTEKKITTYLNQAALIIAEATS